MNYLIKIVLLALVGLILYVGLATIIAGNAIKEINKNLGEINIDHHNFGDALMKVDLESKERDEVIHKELEK